ncbi:1776_t:CDS:10 [Diversispora eburnea]|uniref:cAMP-dependent protein kinase n=1 Tax=Diversispora eburnea TaxID=1213867 RepID=A0A9N8UXI1_9GLOM|nr:1776_t:CDS:10 [Diversispora eburnea]
MNIITELTESITELTTKTTENYHQKPEEEEKKENNLDKENNNWTDNNINQSYYQIFQYDFSQSLTSLYSTKQLFNQTVWESLRNNGNIKKENELSYIPNGLEDNFFKAAKWSPDGSCILTSSNDNILRVFDLNSNVFEVSEELDLNPSLSIHSGETIYEFCWYPLMSNPATCCFLSSSRDHPIHLWDAFTGKSRCSFTIINHRDQVVGPNSLSFNLDGSKNMIKMYDSNRPGYDGIECPTTTTRKSRDGQKGIISCLAFNPDFSGLYAAGSYSQTIGLYDESNNKLLYLLRGSKSEPIGSVTQVLFSPDGNYLFSASRRDNHIRCWDIRNSGEILYNLYRQGDTNQRMSFDIDNTGRYLITGDQYGKIMIYDLNHDIENNENEISKLVVLEIIGHDDNSLKIWKAEGKYEWNYYNVEENITFVSDIPINIGSLDLKEGDKKEYQQQRQVNSSLYIARPTFGLIDFGLKQTLGTGTFGRVFLTKFKHTESYYAMKVLKKSEVVRLKQVEHINSEKLILTGRFTNDMTRFYTAEIVLAIEYLHSKDIIYRDLKPENLLLDSRGHIKITDFGFAKKIEDRTWTLCGTPEYLAPEIIKSNGHGKPVDWWALGILIFEMLAGYPPFFDDNPFGIYEKILAGKIQFPPHFDSNAKDLIKRLLTADRSKRLGNLRGGSEDVKKHKWFRGVDWQGLHDRRIQAPIIPPYQHPGDTGNFEKYPEPTDDDNKLGITGDPYRHLSFQLFQLKLMS